MKTSRVLDWQKRFKEDLYVEIINEENYHNFLRYQGYCSLWIHFARPNSQPSLLYGNAEAVTWSCEYKIPELWPNDWIPHNDNAPADKALSVKQFMSQKTITEIKHQPYSPYLAPNDFRLFPKIKSALKGRKFKDIENIQNIWRRHWKTIHKRNTKNVSNSGSHVGLSAVICLSWLLSVSSKCTGTKLAIKQFQEIHRHISCTFGIKLRILRLL
jgi:hypothetical protein